MAEVDGHKVQVPTPGEAHLIEDWPVRGAAHRLDELRRVVRQPYLRERQAHCLDTGGEGVGERVVVVEDDGVDGPFEGGGGGVSHAVSRLWGARRCVNRGGRGGGGAMTGRLGQGTHEGCPYTRQASAPPRRFTPPHPDLPPSRGKGEGGQPERCLGCARSASSPLHRPTACPARALWIPAVAGMTRRDAPQGMPLHQTGWRGSCLRRNDGGAWRGGGGGGRGRAPTGDAPTPDTHPHPTPVHPHPSRPPSRGKGPGKGEGGRTRE